MVSIHGPLGYEPNTLTTAPLRSCFDCLCMAPCVDSGMIRPPRILGGHLPKNRVDHSLCETRTRPSDILPCASVPDVGDPADVKIRKRVCVGQSLAKPLAGIRGPAAVPPPGLCNHPRAQPSHKKQTEKRRTWGICPTNSSHPQTLEKNLGTRSHKHQPVKIWQISCLQRVLQDKHRHCVRAVKEMDSKSIGQRSTDTVSERLRRWTRNPLGSARRGSNPLGVAFLKGIRFVAGVSQNPSENGWAIRAKRVWPFTKEQAGSVAHLVIQMLNSATICENDTEGIRTLAGRAQWISSPSP